jgi:CelD/BcsL family acetyltransferase involved in cellulose biosynthesis
VAAGESGVSLLVVEEGGAWLGCLPVERRGPAPVLFGWHSPYVFLGTPLVRRGAAEGFAAALVKYLRGGLGRFLLLRRAGVGEVVAALRAAGAAGRVEALFERPESRAALTRHAEDDYLAGMKSKRRSELKRQRRKLGEELGGELEVVEASGPGAVDEFLALESGGWKGREETALAADPETAAFFRDVAGRFGADGRISLRALRTPERVAAMTCDLTVGGVRFGFKTAYDEDLRRFSPGILLLIENFSHFHAGEDVLFDSCSEPDNEPMNTLWPERRELTTVMFGPANPLGKLIGTALRRYVNRRGRMSEQE